MRFRVSSSLYLYSTRCNHTAPTNEAFDALPEGTLESLLLPENIGTLTDILTYHVVGENALSSTLSNGDIDTLNGNTVNVEVSDTGVIVNDANVISPADIIGSNGIVHAIDSVLLPPVDEMESIYNIAEDSEEFTTLGK